MTSKALKTITQILLLSVIALLPLIKVNSLYFPFISGKVYLFRLLVVLAFFFWIWLLLKDRSYKSDFKNILVVALILFFLAQVLVSFFGVDPLFSFFSSIERGNGVFQYGFWLLYFLMLSSVFKEERDWKALFSVFVIVAAILSFYNFFSSGVGQPKISGLFGNPAYFGAFLLFAIGFSLIMFERKFFYRNTVHRFLPLVAIFLTIPLILTQIRGAYAGLVGGVFLFCLLSFLFLRKENRKLTNWSLVVLLVSVISIVALFAQKENPFVQNSQILSRITSVADFWESASVRERLLNWNIVLKAFKEKSLFGWGPENYGVAANKYYDLRIGESEPWFDRAHSNLFDILATGGIFLFLFYLFWIFATFYLISRLTKEQKTLSFILASIFFAYLIQGFFLFDTLAVYLGLFPFLAYLVVASRQPLITTNKLPIRADKKINGNQSSSTAIRKLILVAATVFSIFVMYATVILPWQANNAGWQFFNLTEQGLYKETKPYLEKAFSIKSPYTFWELRRMASWQLMNILDSKITAETKPAKIKEIQELYDFITPELEKCITARPSHPQTYYVLATIYRLGFEKLSKDDLEKAEAVLRKAFNYSDLRAEYFNTFAKVLLLQSKFEEAEKLIQEYTQRMPAEWGKDRPFVVLGNFYFEAEKYEQSLEQYDKARKVGFQIQQNEIVYPRYMLAAEKVGDYERTVEIGQKYLEKKGPDADTYFNVAVGYWYLGDREKAREFFLKAVELKQEYEEYKHFFLE